METGNDQFKRSTALQIILYLSRCFTLSNDTRVKDYKTVVKQTTIMLPVNRFYHAQEVHENDTPVINNNFAYTYKYIFSIT